MPAPIGISQLNVPIEVPNSWGRADVAIEAVGVPQTFELCTKLVRPGSHAANIDVREPATLHLESLRSVTRR
jgi:threonine dehydrogenase-like Zn-dependent dehydrogenase